MEGRKRGKGERQGEGRGEREKGSRGERVRDRERESSLLSDQIQCPNFQQPLLLMDDHFFPSLHEGRLLSIFHICRRAVLAGHENVMTQTGPMNRSKDLFFYGLV